MCVCVWPGKKAFVSCKAHMHAVLRLPSMLLARATRGSRRTAATREGGLLTALS